jgi:PPOX class probable FMN-dependent enzyme
LAFKYIPVHRFGIIKREMSLSENSSVGIKDIGEGGGPTDDTALVSWKSRIDASIAKSRKIRGANYVQLATVSNNEARCRTVVFRGFQKLPSSHPASVECDNTSCVMKMITDNRSQKVREVSMNSSAEMVWWFPKSSEQYRIRGELLFVGNGDFNLDEDKLLATARKEQWGNISDPAREQFFWEKPDVDYTGTPNVPSGGRDHGGNILSPPDSFLLMLLLPQRVDYLRLGDNFRQVDNRVSDDWVMTRANP